MRNIEHSYSRLTITFPTATVGLWKLNVFFYILSKPKFLSGAQPKSLRFGRNKQNPLNLSPDVEPRCGMVATCCTSMQILLSPVITLDTVKHEVLITAM